MDDSTTINQAKESPYTIHKLIVDITAYSSDIEQTDSSPWLTSLGDSACFGIVALSQDLLDKFGYECQVFLPQFNMRFVVKDCMPEKWKNRIDVWLPSKFNAQLFGIKRNCEVQIISKI